MILSKEARAVRKQAQLERLERKGDDDYAEFYANQPTQIVRADLNAKITEARQAKRKARKDLDMARASGVGFERAEKAIQSANTAIVVLQELKRSRFRPQLGARLTGGDA